MDYDNSFKKALYFTRMSVYLAYTWPLPRTATRWEIMRADIAWCLSITSGLCLYFPLMYSIYANRSNSFQVTQTAVFMSGAINFLIKSVVLRVHRKRTQVLLYEMEDFLINAKPHEKIILQRYIERCSPLHIFVSGCTYFAATFTMILLPLIFHDQPLPTNALYPFNVDSGLLKYLVYLHQSLAGLQYAAGATIDCQAALMVWFAGARLEILAQEIINVTAIEGFRAFIKKHKKILLYASEASSTMSYVAFSSSATCGIIAILSALQLFGNQPFIVKVKFGLGIVIGGINLLISAWPADNLIHAFDVLGQAVYDTPWIEMSPNLGRNILMVLLRCQRPILVSVAGFIQSLSLESYISFISGLFSYFTTIRVVMMSNIEM